MKPRCTRSIVSMLPSLGVVCLTLLTLACISNSAWAEGDLTERSKAVAVEAGQSVAAGAGSVWQTVEEKAFSGWARGEIVAWMLVGALVGAMAGMLTSIRSTGMGRFGRVLLGLIGAFIGGVAVRVGDLDWGWNPLQIRYEELLFAFAGAVLVILLARVARAATQKKQA